MDAARSPAHVAIAAALALAIGTSARPAVAAGTSSAEFTVLATVRAVARIDAGTPHPSIEVSPADVARGYLDVGEPWNLNVESNDPGGVRLQVLAMAPMFRTIEVTGLGAEVNLGPAGGDVVLRWHDRRNAQLALRFRFLLAPGVQPGRYPWPLQVVARPLSSI